MKISVVLLTYNRAHVLPQTVDSILAQTRGDFELIIQDDHSTDGTEHVCREYAARDARIVYVRNPQNLRMPGNLNEGIRRARGEYVANLHDGDVYAPTLLEKWAAALDRCPEAAFVFNAYRALNPDGSERTIYREPLPSCFPGTALLEEFFFRRWHFDSPVWGTVMARRSAYEEVGLFDPRFEFYADVDMWMKLAERHHVAYVDEPLIGLPAREALPRLFEDDAARTRRLLEQMFWEARVRHYADDHLRRAVEVARHRAYSIGNRAVAMALSVRRRLRRASAGA